VRFYRQVREDYPEAQRLWIVEDNWVIHFHPDVLVALEPQESPFPIYRSRSWPSNPSVTATKKWGDLRLPIQLLPLPTYASWANPIEKLWRLLRQRVLHLHRKASELPELRRIVKEFLDGFASGSPDVLRYVGLGIPT
jgi:hypothetical protein